jgi:ABC-type uncharacterized transport system involved in gliding motility auxiliary subunit
MSFVEKLSRSTLAWGCLIMAAIILLSVNVLSDMIFQSAKVDLTDEQLYTLSEGTYEVLHSVDEPINVRLYFSSDLGEAVPTFQRYFERVRSLLEQYADISGGKLIIQVFDPEPFSDAEDRAVAAGLTGVPLGEDGVNGYFGYAASNSTDNQLVMPFLAIERERYLEYDLTKLVYSLANPVKQSIGVISPLPMVGGFDFQGGGQQPDWQAIAQLREFYSIVKLNPQSSTIPDTIDMLIIAQPVGLSDELLYEIDQFALAGGNVLIFADPNVEIGRGQIPGVTGGVQDTGIEHLLNTWGVAVAETTVVGDIDYARRVQFGSSSQPVVVDYIAWMTVDAAGLDANEVISGGIERLNFATAGVVEQVPGATTDFTPLVSTGPRPMRLQTSIFATSPNPQTLLDEYVEGDGALALAARVVGDVSTAFPDGRPVAEGEEADEDANEGHIGEGRVHAVVVTDVDFLYDSLWVRVQEFLGSQVAIPLANNGDFVLNVIENLSGGEALIGLRGRGVQTRPFHMVEEIRARSEEQYRAREQALNAKLEELQGNLRNLERTAEGGTVILTEDQQEAIEAFRQEMIVVRSELREVKRALRADIDRLELTLKFANIAAMPILIGIFGLGAFAFRRARQRSGARTA